MCTPNHKYYVCLKHQEEPVAWDPYAPTSTITIHDAYFGGVFRAMESMLDATRLTVYITWDLHELPTYGQDVVVVILGDEWCQTPSYADRVLAVFKCYGTSPALGIKATWPPSYMDILLALQFARVQYHRLPGTIRAAISRVRQGPIVRTQAGSNPPPVHTIPLGYASQENLPVRPIMERSSDLFFAGSLTHNRHPWWSPLHWLRSPKHVAREQMIHEVERLGTSQPDLRIKLHVTSDFAPHVQMYERENADVMDADTYSAHMMNARICLAPRGTSPETFRYFEGLRAGCIVITDTMPDHWFYADSPAVEIDDWRTLGEVVLSVLRDPDRLQDMHEKSLQWWDERCSETALAAFITEVIESRIGHGHRSEPAQRLHTTPR